MPLKQELNDDLEDNRRTFEVSEATENGTRGRRPLPEFGKDFLLVGTKQGLREMGCSGREELG